ncbi:MAG: 5-(carboxyamino)imidazole ribonucleotide mutase [candidate division WOR-3 bacterium]
MAKIAVIIGSESDRDRMKPGIDLLEDLGIEYELVVLSAHRNPVELGEHASRLSERGFEVVIAGAGLSAALPGAIAARTELPVIGVPFDAGTLGGLDALLSMTQMPRGVPVATVGINNPINAAILALRILALRHHWAKEALGKIA